MATSLLPSLSLLQAKRKKKWEMPSKLAIIALFTAITIEEEINVIATSLLLSPIFPSSRKKKWATIPNLLLSPFSQQQEKKKKCDNSKLIVVTHFCFK
jgi:hypothetical protein